VTGELRERLRAALDGADTLERELGGAGMSRVFVAEDARLGRRVVKVLGPELTEGVSAERFAREVRVAARLQHPTSSPSCGGRARAVMLMGRPPDAVQLRGLVFGEPAPASRSYAAGGIESCCRLLGRQDESLSLDNGVRPHWTPWLDPRVRCA